MAKRRKIDKPRREWNSNQRYYDFTLDGKKELFAHVHIPSAMQHRKRSAVDVLIKSKEPDVASFRKKAGLENGLQQVFQANR